MSAAFFCLALTSRIISSVFRASAQRATMHSNHCPILTPASRSAAGDGTARHCLLQPQQHPLKDRHRLQRGWRASGHQSRGHGRQHSDQAAEQGGGRIHHHARAVAARSANPPPVPTTRGQVAVECQPTTALISCRGTVHTVELCTTALISCRHVPDVWRSLTPYPGQASPLSPESQVRSHGDVGLITSDSIATLCLNPGTPHGDGSAEHGCLKLY